MAIEPLGSIMTVQAQHSQQNTAAKPIQVSREVNPTETQINNIDPTTVSVAKAGDTMQQQNAGSQSKHFDEAEDQVLKQQNEKIKKAVEQMNKNLPSSEAVFGIHEATNRVTIKIINRDTKEVIKELPPEKTLDMIAKVWEIAGMMVDERR